MIRAKLIVFSLGLTAVSYIAVCQGIGLHYNSRARGYEDAAQELNQEYIEAGNFSNESWCEVKRYFDASEAAIDEMSLNPYRMIVDWNKDFLAQQPNCPGRKTQ